jgi:ATP-dependent Clp protease adaptor protein ClpS
MDTHKIKKIRTLEMVKLELKKPCMYKVVLVNDDFTPMDFVVEILKKIFNLSDECAISIMLEVHHQGRGICGVFTHEIAETKVYHVTKWAKINEYPLLCCMEPDTLSLL